ncbi:MAG: PPK2 family polyphosphate kinase, partial [Gemmatirosa sp.]
FRRRSLDLEPVAPGARVRLTDRLARPPQGLPEGEALAEATDRALDKVGDLQQRLYSDDRYGVLVVLQGRDASGKDGVIRKVFGACSPLGLHIAAFAAPSTIERHHDFLWRVHQQVPARRYLGVFNRSHYEDVLAARVRALVPRKVWKHRYEQINAFEATLGASGITVLKFFLHVSREEQKRRLLERLDDPTKRWKFDPDDLDDRDRWDEYTEAYQDALSRCSTPDAPWFVVPADDDKVRDYLIARTLRRALKGLDLQYPTPDFDVAACRARLLADDGAPRPADDADDAPPA